MMTAGDLLYIHYSGHGTQIPDYSDTELNGYHEALYLYDGPFQDDRLVELQALTPAGVKVIAKLTVVSQVICLQKVHVIISRTGFIRCPVYR